MTAPDQVDESASEHPARPARPVILIAAAMIVAALAFRTWAVFGGWFQFDDVVFLTRVNGEPLSWHLLFDGYGGHLLPVGFLITWLFGHDGSLDYAPYALTLILLQAIAAVGVVHLLRSLFGWRRGILPVLALYLFSAISLPGFIWYAAGIQQLGLQIALGWGLALHLAYLRSPSRGRLLATLAVLAVSLLFYEKVLLVFGAIAIVTFGWFATGSAGQRIRQIWARYRLAVIGYVVLGGGYLVLYLVQAFDFGTKAGDGFPLFGLIGNMAGRTLGPGLVGGPLEWKQLTGAFLLVNPSPVVIVVSVLALGALIVHLDQVRSRTRRAWLLPLWFFLANVALIGPARASLLGPGVGLELRNVSELSLAFAIGLGLATMPLLGAVESSEKVADSPFLDSREWPTIATVLLALLGTFSSYQYADHWRDNTQAKSYFANADKTLGSKADPTPLINTSVPQYIMWGYDYPANTVTHVLHSYGDRMRFPEVAVDRINMVDDDGTVAPILISPAVSGVPPLKSCAYRSRDGKPALVPLQQQLKGKGWWARASYYSSEATTAEIRVGRTEHSVRLPSGLHTVYFTADGPAGLLSVTAQSASRFCVNNVDFGQPEPVSAP